MERRRERQGKDKGKIEDNDKYRERGRETERQ